MSDQRIDTLVDRIVNNTKAWKGGEERSRDDIISACFGMIQELEAPSETFVRMTWEQPCQLAAAQTALDLDLYRHINADDIPKSIIQLAEAVNADPGLLTRILRVLASVGIVREVEVGKFASAPMSKALETPNFISSMNFITDFSIPVNLKTPAFLRDTKYQNPTNMLDTPFQFLHGGRGEMNCFQIMHKHDYAKNFEAMMKVWQTGLTHWSDDTAGYYPITERLLEGARKGDDEVFIVDIGGGQGNDLMKLLALHPQETLPGRLILQDLPQLIESIPAGSLSDTIQAMAYDYLTPQPIKGARTYFLHNIIHDLPNDRATEVLRHIRAAMTPSYSKLIIWDFALADRDVPPFVATMDWQMLTYIAGHERTEQDWRALIEAEGSGLRVDGFWGYSKYDQSVIEVGAV